MKNKTVLTTSTNVIKSFQTNKKHRCLMACNLNFPCMLIIYNLNGLCTLCKIGALNELIDTAIGVETNVYQNHISYMMNGLVNYWPIINNLRDYIGSSDMTAGSLSVNETIGFTNDRFNNPNGAIFMNPGYYMIPPGIYFNSSYSILIWVKLLAYASFSRVIDCGNGQYSNNIIICLSDSGNLPYTQIIQGSSFVTIKASNSFQLNTWFHLAVVYDGQNLMMYVNASLLFANGTSAGPLNVNRTLCYIGRSNWYSNGDKDSYAYFDDMMFYNRALTTNEIQDRMNFYLN